MSTSKLDGLVYRGTKPEDRFSFENDFPIDAWIAWVWAWRAWTMPVAGVYLLLVFLGRRWMQERPAYRLKPALILWNVLLGGFSLAGAYRCAPVLWHSVLHNGWHSTICDDRYYGREFIGVWGLLFTVSKIPELADTIFIVLRKQKLILLHWYHHASVPLFVFYIYGDRAGPGAWFATMNYVVHGLMYPYFAVRSAGFRFPRWVSMAITTLQILQMATGTAVVSYAALMQLQGSPCTIGFGVLVLSVVLYTSYLVLFANFFLASYFGKRPPTQVVRDGKEESSKGNDITGVYTNDLRRRGIKSNRYE